MIDYRTMMLTNVREQLDYHSKQIKALVALECELMTEQELEERRESILSKWVRTEQ